MSETNIPVIEFSGTPRSGKGTLINLIQEATPDDVVVVEAGKKYRESARLLINNGVIGSGFEDAETESVLNGLYLYGAESFFEGESTELTESELYSPETTLYATMIANHPFTRRVIRHLLITELSEIGEEQEAKLVLLDGRRMERVVEESYGVEMRQRLFITCTVGEATRRECARLGVDIDSEEGLELYQMIQKVTQKDLERKNDPAAPEPDSIIITKPSELNDAVKKSTRRQLQIDTTTLTIQELGEIAKSLMP